LWDRVRQTFQNLIQGAIVARETSYFVQSFNAGRGGNLKAETPIACKSAAGALRTAERLAPSKLGVVAFSATGDPEMGDYDEEPDHCHGTRTKETK
jgi:hypothetical protein